MRVLLVEDDEMLGEATARGLRLAYAVDRVATAEDAALAVATTAYDIVLLDINLPGQSGLDFLKGLRDAQAMLPVILLTANDAVSSRVAGLNMGADDYVVKPFDLDELIARIAALIRRAHGRASPAVICGQVSFGPQTRIVTCAGKPVPLSAREMAVLEILMNRAGQIVSRAEIENHIYDWQDSERIESNTVEVHISALRRKLGHDFIKTSRGLGYSVSA